MKKNILTHTKTFLIIIFINYLPIISMAEEKGQKETNFKSLKHNNSNMRLGPGERFEIKWNFKKIGLPVKIIQKYDLWFEVETSDGSKGWMLNRLLSKKQTVIFKQDSFIYKKPNITSKLIANVDKNSIVKIKSCKNEWCKIESETHKIKGYTMRKHIWGAIVSETN